MVSTFPVQHQAIYDLKSGVVEDKPHRATVGSNGSAMAGASLMPGSVESAAGCAVLFMAITSLSPMKSLLPHPSLSCGISEFGKARGKQSVKGFEIPPSGLCPGPWCSQFGISRDSRGPRAHSDICDGCGWSSFVQQCVLSTYYKQAVLGHLAYLSEPSRHAPEPQF